jgi:hypothetical protein
MREEKNRRGHPPARHPSLPRPRCTARRCGRTRRGQAGEKREKGGGWALTRRVCAQKKNSKKHLSTEREVVAREDICSHDAWQYARGLNVGRQAMNERNGLRSARE